jgi:hypothetical protein
LLPSDYESGDVRRSERKLKTPDMGIRAVRLLFGLQSELFGRAARRGFDDLRPRHGAVLAYLDDDGIRLGDLTRIAGRNKQTIAAIVDELEDLGPCGPSPVMAVLKPTEPQKSQKPDARVWPKACPFLHCQRGCAGATAVAERTAAGLTR